MATLAQDDERALIVAAVAKALFTAAEGDEALRQARTSGQPVAEVLVERGLLAPRTIESLRSEVAEGGGGAGRLGDYEVLEKLGEGGMGAVYRARQVNLDREVALKVVSPQVAADPEYAERFLREARAAAKVSHPNVITIFDAGRVDGRLLMALELMRGGDAAQLAKRAGGRLSEARALQVARDCARGLQALEKAGLVHRDIKPANVFIGADGGAKLADLGLARARSGDDRMTNSGVVVGTPAFMAPEQADGSPDIDVRTDVYALGATLFQLVTGAPPYTGSSPLVVVSKVLTAPVPDPRALRPDLSAATAEVIVRALAKDRAARFQSATELLVALERARAALGGRADPRPQPAGRVIGPARGSARHERPGTLASAAPAERSRPGPLVAVGIAAVLATFGVAAGALLRRDAPPAPATVPGRDRQVARGSDVTDAPPPPPARYDAATPTPPAAHPAGAAKEASRQLGVPSRVRAVPWLVRPNQQAPAHVEPSGDGFLIGAGRGEFARASFVDQLPIRAPAQVRFELAHPRIDATDTALADQGFVLPAGFFYEVGVKLDEGEVRAGAELRSALWLSLASSRERTLCLMRAVDGQARDHLRPGAAPGLRVVPAANREAADTFEAREGHRYEVLFVLEREGWRCAVQHHVDSGMVDEKQYAGTWSDLGVTGEPESLWVWAHAGSWGAEGRGTGRLTTARVEPIGTR